METNVNVIEKKKITLFMVIAYVGTYIIKLLTNGVYLMYFDKISQTADQLAMTDYATAASSISSFVNLFLSFGLYFVLAKILTNDKKKILSFIGSVYFGIAASGIISSFFSAASKFMMSLISPSDASIISLVGDVLSLPFAAFVAIFAFSALEGVCDKLPNESAETIDTSLSKMRKTFIIAYILVYFIVYLFDITPTLIFSLTSAYENIGNYWNGISGIFTWLSNTIILVMEYFLAYKVSKKHIDAVAFMVVFKFADKMINIVQGALFAIINTAVALLGLKSEDTLGAYASVMSIIAMIVSLITAVIMIVLIWRLLKIYFPQSPKFPQTQAVQPMPYETTINPQETDTSSTLQNVIKDIEG